jgi:hypothetical protein
MTEELATIHATMSKTDDLLACAWRWGRQAPRDTGSDASRFGVACHDIYAKLGAEDLSLKDTKALRAACVAVGDSFKVDAKEVESLVVQSWPVFSQWMKGANPFRINFHDKGLAKYEYSVAYNVTETTARECESPNEATHVYGDCDYETELPGTADVVFYRRKEYLCILDYKTGEDVPEPSQSGQLKSLAVALVDIYPEAKQVIVGLLHAPRRTGVPTVYVDTLSAKDIAYHRDALCFAWQQRGLSMSPGTVCQYCPLLTSCPTQSSMLVELKKGSAGNLALTSERVGAIHVALQQYDSLAEQLRSQLKAWVRTNGPAVRPDGKVLDIVKREYETLSKTSLMTALGAVEGEKELAKLRKRGCLKKDEREELRAENDKGR